jgi:hypothetical protein
MAMTPGSVDVRAIRRHFTFPEAGRIATNNAASTQPPRELLALYRSLAPGYENVHRGQSTASQQMTALFEESYDTVAEFIGAPGRASIALYRNTTEVINAVIAARDRRAAQPCSDGRVRPGCPRRPRGARTRRWPGTGRTHLTGQSRRRGAWRQDARRPDTDQASAP